MALDLWLEPVLPWDGLYCLLTLVTGSAACWLWAQIGSRWRRRLGLPGLALFAVAVVTVITLARYPDWDETEHLHASWLVSQGREPYRDFWQHHSPLLWLLLSPVLGRMAPGPHVLDFSRAISMGIGLACGGLAVWMARRLHGTSEVDRYVAALWLGIAGTAELYNLRPDLGANLCSLGATALLLGGRRLPQVVLSGVLLGLAVAFTPKHLPLLMAFPLVLATERAGVIRTGWSVVVHWTGVALGALPLLVWLHQRNLISDYFQWVIQFNGDSRLRLGGLFPLIPTLLAAAWVVRRCANRCSALEPGERLFMAVLGLSAVMMIVQPFHKFVYGLQTYLLLCCAAGAMEGKRFADVLWRRRGYLTLGALVALLYLPAMLITVNWFARGEYFAGRQELRALIEATGQDSVVAVPPAHPIFAHDATDISQPWQWNWWLGKRAIRERLTGLVPQIMRKRPALVVAGTYTLSLSSLRTMPSRRLVSYGVVSEEEGLRLQQFLECECRLVRFGRNYLWLRNDRPVPPGAEVALEREEEVENKDREKAKRAPERQAPERREGADHRDAEDEASETNGMKTEN